MQGTRAFFDTLRFITAVNIPDVSPILPSAAVGDPLQYPARMIRLVNGTDGYVYISTNSFTNVANAQLVLAPITTAPNACSIVFDFTTNQTFDGGFFLPANTQFYAGSEAGSSPANGTFFIMVVYSKS